MRSRRATRRGAVDHESGSGVESGSGKTGPPGRPSWVYLFRAMSPARIAPTVVALAALAAPWGSSHAEGAWTIETVEAGGLAMIASLALDPSGAPRMAYNSGAQPHYAWREAGGWTWESLSTPPAPGSRGAERSGEIAGVQLIYFVVPSLAIDQVTAAPRIAYVKYPEDDVWYAERSGAAWTYERLSVIGNAPSLALDSQGRPHVAFQDVAAGVTYAVRDEATWTYEPVGVDEGNPALRLDSQDRPHLAMGLASPNSDLLHAAREVAGWSVEAADTSGDVGHGPSLALDGSGEPHISYYDATAHALRYAFRADGEWTVETVATPGGDWCPNSLALAPGGQPFIAFQDVNAHDLRFARREAGVWTSELVDSAGFVGDYCSLAVDDQGRPHIGYYDTSNYRLRYATRSAVVGVAPVSPEAGFARLSPNPLRAGQAFDLVLRLEAPCMIEAELLDVTGRRMAAHAPVTLAAGVQTLRWNPGIRRAGLYFLRVRSDRGGRLGARLVIVP